MEAKGTEYHNQVARDFPEELELRAGFVNYTKHSLPRGKEI